MSLRQPFLDHDHYSDNNNNHSSMTTSVPVPPSSSSGVNANASAPTPLGQHLIAFVNGNSGGKAGAELLSYLQKRLGADRVVNLATTLPRDGIRFASQNGLRIVACGGDGTVNWLLSTINSLHLPKQPPVVIVPLGTGNDTARQFGWGNKWEGTAAMLKMLNHSVDAPMAEFDRWHIEIQHDAPVPDEIAETFPAGLMPLGHGQVTQVQFYPSTPALVPSPATPAAAAGEREHKPSSPPFPSPIVGDTIAAVALDEKQPATASAGAASPPTASDGGSEKKKKKKDYTRCEGQWNNYLSFGIDAQVTYSYHHHRETNRGCYCCRCCNMTWMFCCGCMACCCCTAIPTRLKLEIREPGGDWQVLPLPRDIHAVVFLNLRTYAGGRDVWPRKRDDAAPGPSHHMQRMDDGYLEVFGISNTFHLGRIVSDCSNGLRLTQCHEARVTSTVPMFVQMDGEPWHDTSSVYHIRRLASAQMVVGPRAAGDVKAHARQYVSGVDVPLADAKSNTFLTVGVPTTTTSSSSSSSANNTTPLPAATIGISTPVHEPVGVAPAASPSSATSTSTPAAAVAPTEPHAAVTVTTASSSSSAATAPSTVTPLVPI